MIGNVLVQTIGMLQQDLSVSVVGVTKIVSSVLVVEVLAIVVEMVVQVRNDLRNDGLLAIKVADLSLDISTISVDETQVATSVVIDLVQDTISSFVVVPMVEVVCEDGFLRDSILEHNHQTSVVAVVASSVLVKILVGSNDPSTYHSIVPVLDDQGLLVVVKKRTMVVVFVVEAHEVEGLRLEEVVVSPIKVVMLVEVVNV